MGKVTGFLFAALLCCVSMTAADAGEKRLVIGANNYLKGIYSLDILEKAFLTTCEALGVDSVIVNDEGKLENSVSGVDNLIAAGVDGIVFSASRTRSFRSLP